MWVIKQCKCGSTNFTNDDNTLRCEDCGRLADFTYIKENEDEND